MVWGPHRRIFIAPYFITPFTILWAQFPDLCLPPHSLAFTQKLTVSTAGGVFKSLAAHPQRQLGHSSAHKTEGFMLNAGIQRKGCWGSQKKKKKKKIAQFWFRLRSKSLPERKCPLCIYEVSEARLLPTLNSAIRQGSLELLQAFLDELQAQPYPL